jgi:hypothetical protein
MHNAAVTENRTCVFMSLVVSISRDTRMEQRPGGAGDLQFR